ncbi:MAG: non-heme iron oxygenase ferredoxin subunit [Planctomycetota bacterium]
MARRSELSSESGKRVDVNGRAVGLFVLDNEVFAVDDCCTHADASLCEGDVIDGEVICPIHFAPFDIRTGACNGPPADEDLQTHEVRVVGDDVEVKVSD